MKLSRYIFTWLFISPCSHVGVGAERLAMCIQGPVGRIIPSALQSLRVNVLDVLKPDLFVVSRYNDQLVGQNSEAKKQSSIRDTFESILGAFADADIAPDNTTLVDTILDIVPNPDFWYNYPGNTIFAYDWSKYPKDFSHEVEPDRHNKSVMVKKRRRNSPMQLLMKKSCYDVVTRYERQHGIQYSRIIVSRFDLYFLVPHPHLHLFPRNIVFIPEGQDFGGLNDRYAIIPREFAENYLLIWNELISGRLQRIYENSEMLAAAENTLLLTLRAARVPVGRFLPIAALKCCDPGPQCHSGNDTFKLYECDENGFRTSSASELAVARATAALLLQGWNWATLNTSSVGSRLLARGCFPDHDHHLSNDPGGIFTKASCCDERGGTLLGGRAICWRSNVHSFHRCCNDAVDISVGLHPPRYIHREFLQHELFQSRLKTLGLTFSVYPGVHDSDFMAYCCTYIHRISNVSLWPRVDEHVTSMPHNVSSMPALCKLFMQFYDYC